MKPISIYTLLLIIILGGMGCQNEEKKKDAPPSTEEHNAQLLKKYDALFLQHPEYIADGFDFPLGPPDGKGYYNAQAFTQNNHLGDDINGRGGGDSDLGDTIHSIAHGYVKYYSNFGRRSGWGNVVYIIHQLENHPLDYVVSMYAHCDTVLIKHGQWVKKGDPIATVGNVDGLYKAHLHLELRADIFKGVGSGYGTNIEGYLNPSLFIQEHRQLPK